jgi:hypothetical protein
MIIVLDYISDSELKKSSTDVNSTKQLLLGNDSCLIDNVSNT